MAKAYIKQHIVPKSYLDRFGVKDGKNTIIGTRIKHKGKPHFFTSSTSDVGYIKNFYDVTDKDDPKYWEHFFAREIDTLCGHEMENIIAKVTLSQVNATVLSVHDKEVLSKVIVAQLFRIPSSFDYMTNQIYPKVSKQVKEEMAAILLQALLEKYGEQIRHLEISEQYQKELMLNYTFAPENFNRYCEILQNGIWIIFFNKQRSAMPFMTSDNPVLVEGFGNTQLGVYHNGLANPATCIFYPLSPAVAVAIYSRQGILGVGSDTYDGKNITLDDLKYIMDKNRKIMEQAYCHSFIPQPLFDVIISGTI